MTFREAVADRGYEFIPTEKPYIKIKKYDSNGVSDVLIIFDTETKTITGGLIALVPIKTIDHITHQYEVFRIFTKDLQYFASQSGCDII